MFKQLQLSILLAFISSVCISQEILVKGHFEGDTVKLGQPIQFHLTATYPQSVQVLFPDSTFSFAPFEFQKKKFFTTKTENGISYDSVTYTLSTYEIDSLQRLALPVFQLQKKDCVVFYSETDTVFFKKLVNAVPDSLAINQLPLKTNTAYSPVSWLLNYPLALIIGGSLLLIALIVWISFGKRIRKYFTVKRLTRSHAAFMNRFEQSVEKVKSSFSPELAESSVLIWKKYMEELSAKPYTKYTSREIRETENDELGQTLHSVDRMVYGRISPETFDSFQQLKDFTQNRFNQKIEEVKHG
ncbi:MAG TPA: LapA family protein [Cyclobacteriaceae bacterium]|nr:LapA family protein [Cyclobacteriaceae bacterium]HPW61760.1 LapA family protein [Cyclobacteriaceae bacterium]